MTFTASRSSRSIGISGSRSGFGISGSRASPAGRSAPPTVVVAGRVAGPRRWRSSRAAARRWAGRAAAWAGPRAARGSSRWAGIVSVGGDLADGLGPGDLPGGFLRLPGLAGCSTAAASPAGPRRRFRVDDRRSRRPKASRRRCSGCRGGAAPAATGCLGSGFLPFFRRSRGAPRPGLIHRARETHLRRRAFPLEPSTYAGIRAASTLLEHLHLLRLEPEHLPHRARTSAGGWRRRPVRRSAATWSGVGYPLCRAKP